MATIRLQQKRTVQRQPRRGVAPVLAGIGGMVLIAAVLLARPAFPLQTGAVLVLYAAMAITMPGLWIGWRTGWGSGPGGSSIGADGWVQVVLGQLAVGMAGCVLLGRWEGLIVLPLMAPGLMALRAAGRPEVPAATRPWAPASRHRLAWVTVVDMYLLLAGLKLVWTAATPNGDLYLGPAWALAALCVVAALRFGSPGAILLSVRQEPEGEALVVDGRVFERERFHTLLLGVLAFGGGVAWLLGWRAWVRPVELFGESLWPGVFLVLNLAWAWALMAVGYGLCRARTGAAPAGIALAVAALGLVMGRAPFWAEWLPLHLSRWSGVAEHAPLLREMVALLACAALLLFGWAVCALGAAWLRFREMDRTEGFTAGDRGAPPMFPYFPS